MSTLGFDSYVEPLKLYLQKFREVSVLLRTVGIAVHSGFKICPLKCFAAKYVTFPVAFAVFKLEYVKYHTFPCLLFILNFSR